MSIDTRQRTEAPEIMDDFTLKGEELRDALDKIAAINRFLGGNALTLQGVKSLIKTLSKQNEISIYDVGCGNGDMLRALSEFGKRSNIKFRLTGIDANAFTIEYAQKLSRDYPEIHYLCENIFSEQFSKMKYDIVLCTLTLHHFTNNEIIRLMNVFKSNAAVGIVINDLQRSIVPYRLFQIVSVLFGLNKMSVNDGLVSILRGFKKEELEAFSKQLNLNKYTIQWKWAFRYQWVISNL